MRGRGRRALAALALLWLPLAARGETPEVLYMLHCPGCHLPDGGGTPGAVPPLKDSVGRFALLPAGRAYLVQVPGSALSPLTDAELAAVLNWMVRRFGPEPAAFEPFGAAEVRRARRPLSQVQEARRELLAELAAREAR